MVFSILISQPLIYSASTCLPCISESTDQLSIWECLIGVCVEFVSTWTYMWARWAVSLSIVLRTSRTLSFWVVRMRQFFVWVAGVIHLKYITRGWLLEEVLYSMKTSIAFLISTVHEKMIISDNLQYKEIRLSVLGTPFWMYCWEIETHFPIKYERTIKISGRQAYTFFVSSILWNKCKTPARLYLKVKKFSWYWFY